MLPSSIFLSFQGALAFFPQSVHLSFLPLHPRLARRPMGQNRRKKLLIEGGHLLGGPSALADRSVFNAFSSYL